MIKIDAINQFKQLDSVIRERIEIDHKGFNTLFEDYNNLANLLIAMIKDEQEESVPIKEFMKDLQEKKEILKEIKDLKEKKYHSEILERNKFIEILESQ